MLDTLNSLRVFERTSSAATTSVWPWSSTTTTTSTTHITCTPTITSITCANYDEDKAACNLVDTAAEHAITISFRLEQTVHGEGYVESNATAFHIQTHAIFITGEVL